jgi:hypothetical protein
VGKEEEEEVAEAGAPFLPSSLAEDYGLAKRWGALEDAYRCVSE